MKRPLPILGILYIVANTIFSIVLILKEHLFFNIDIARDLLLLKDIVEKNHFTLIGARTSFTGLFHGPAWLYLNVPAYILSHGNPLGLATFWLLLYVLFLLMTFFLTRELFDTKTAFLSTIILSSMMPIYTQLETNPYGAMLLFPLYFFSLLMYIKKQQPLFLILTFLIAGFFIQFEMAFGIPILITTFIYLIFFTKKHQHISHLLSSLVLIIPLSTFILFDIKHDFLQTKSLLSIHHSNNGISMMSLMVDRLSKFTIFGWQLFQLTNPYEGYDVSSRLLDILVGISIGFATWKMYAKNEKQKMAFILFFILYVGFWIGSFFFADAIAWYYYWPFISAIAILFSLTRKYISPNIFYGLFFLILVHNSFFVGKLLFVDQNKTTAWHFQKQLTTDIYNDAPVEFGYFINTFDQISTYTTLYPMEYMNNQFPGKKSFSFVKKPITYFIIAPYPNGQPLDNTFWKLNRVKITSQPIAVKKYDNGFIVEKYLLTNNDLQAAPDPTIFQSTSFR